MFRILLIIHRYLGIGLGVVVFLWCLSGFVMMYVQYPQLSDEEYRNGLQTIDVQQCCKLGNAALEQISGVESFSVEMLAGRPVLRAHDSDHTPLLADLIGGELRGEIDQRTAAAQTYQFLQNSGNLGIVNFKQVIDKDQWTVAGRFDSARPLFLFNANDDAATEVYVSTQSGKVVQVTTARERFWNWFGSITHWIYPTGLRKNTGTWRQVVISLSLASLFLVLVGLYLGIRQFSSEKYENRSIYTGITLWHHYSGLIFGTLTLTWLFSGLLSMNPWGVFASAGAATERQLLRQRTIDGSDLQRLVASITTATLPPDTVMLRSTMILGHLDVIAHGQSGALQRLNGVTLQPAPLDEEILDTVASVIADGTATIESGYLQTADDYYYSHHEPVAFPVYRVILDDAERTRFYFDTATAELLSRVDGRDRWQRWLFLALHRGDFNALLRQRPLWDVVLLILLAGVTMGSATGLYLGVRRMRRQTP